MMAFFSSKVYYLESEHVLSEVVPVLEDDGVLLVAPHLVRQRIRVLPHLRMENNFCKNISLNQYGIFYTESKNPKQRKKKELNIPSRELELLLKREGPQYTLDSKRNIEQCCFKIDN
jgi:hypothetical protein